MTTLLDVEQWIDEANVRSRFVSRTLQWKRLHSGQVMARLPDDKDYAFWDKKIKDFVYYSYEPISTTAA